MTTFRVFILMLMLTMIIIMMVMVVMLMLVMIMVGIMMVVLTFIIVIALKATSRRLVIDFALVAGNRHGLVPVGLAADDELAVSGVVAAHHEVATVVTVLGWDNVALDGNGAVVVVAVGTTIV